MNTMKNINKIFLILSAMIFMSCSDYLERTPSAELNEEEVFSDFQLSRQYLLGLYQTLRGGFQEFNMSDTNDGWGYDLTSNMDDHVMGSKTDNSTFELITGGWMRRSESENWGNALAVSRKWRFTYQSIRAINIFLENYSKVPLNTDEERDEMDNMVGEAYFLRAHHYLELVRRWGGVPLVTRVIDANEDQRISRSDINECIKQIVSDCDEAANLLDTEVSSAQWLGRVTKGAALGVKARALLWGASQYWTAHGSTYTWQDAAKAALAVIDLDIYQLYTGDYRKIFLEVFNNEVIYCQNTTPKMMWDLYLYAPAYVGGVTYGNFQPTQEFVDCFEIKDNNGTYVPYDRSNADHLSNMYNADRRDPRFKAMVLYNGANWQGVTCNYYDGGTWGYSTEGEMKNHYYTGYCFVKYWDENVRVGEVNGVPRGGNPRINWIFLRYADILLMYAEAQNQAGGPTSSADGTSKTALWAINEVRKRAGLTGLPASISKEDFDARLRTERAVELCMEDQRFFDVRRWGIGEILSRNLHKVMATKNNDGTFTYDFSQTVGPARAKYSNKDQYILYPIHLEELRRNPNLVQNPGWQDVYRQ